MAKTIYKDSQKIRLPGVTTITSELGWNKQVLVNWANKLGLRGINSREYVDDKADIGTLGHQMVIDHIRGTKSSTDDYSKNQIDKAENCLLSYLGWEKGKKVSVINTETPMVSEKLKFGGTPDFLGYIDDKLTLVDYKTGKGIYLEYWIQVAGGYLLLLEESGHKVDDIVILNIPRAEDESFQVQYIPQAKWGVCKEIFLNCLSTYKLKKKLTKE